MAIFRQQHLGPRRRPSRRRRPEWESRAHRERCLPLRLDAAVRRPREAPRALPGPGFPRARSTVQPVRPAGAGLAGGDRHLLLHDLRRNFPHDGKGRGERAASAIPFTSSSRPGPTPTGRPATCNGTSRSSSSPRRARSWPGSAPRWSRTRPKSSRLSSLSCPPKPPAHVSSRAVTGRGSAMAATTTPSSGQVRFGTRTSGSWCRRASTWSRWACSPGPARAGRADVLLRLAARGARPAGGRRDRGGPGHADGVAAAMAVGSLPRCAPRRRPRGALQPRQPPALLCVQRHRTGHAPVVSWSALSLRWATTRPSRCGTSTTSTAATCRTATATTTLKAFRAWLQRRYGSVEALNEAWGTTFWSQRYGEFAEVLPPRLTPTFVNPGQELDYKRFSNDAFLEEFFEERQILRTARPDIPVTTNFMGFFKPLDYFAWASELDVVSTDNYADPADPDAMMLSAMHYDLVRSLNKDAAWMVMEQTPLRVNWRRHNMRQGPGQMRAMSYQAVARGAAGVLFFQWRASRSGRREVPLGDGLALRRGLAGVGGGGRARRGTGTAWARFEGSGVDARVAMVFSWANWWALEAPAKPANDLSMTDQLSWMYRPLFRSRRHSRLLPARRTARPLRGRAGAQPLPGDGGGAAPSSCRTWSAAVRRWSLSGRGSSTSATSSTWGRTGARSPPDRLRRGGRGPIARGHDDRGRMGGRDQDGGFFLGRRGDRGHGPCAGPRRRGPWAGRPAVVEARVGQGRAYYLACRLDAAGLARVYDLAPALSGEPAVHRGGAGCGARGAHLGRPHVRVPHKPLGGGKGARYRLRGV